MKRYILLTSLLIGTLLTAGAQPKKWTLQQCIDYALEHNVQIKKEVLNTKYRTNQLQQSKNDRLPAVNANVGSSLNFGRSLGNDNTYSNVNSMSADGYIGAEIDLFNGFQKKNTIAQNDFTLKASLKDLQKAKDDISIAVAADFLEVLLAEELERIANAQLKITQQQIDRTKQLVEAGSLAQGKLLEIKAQLALEQLQLVDAQNKRQLALLNLAQLLDLNQSIDFDVELPKISEVTGAETPEKSANIFDQAVASRPEIASAQYVLDSKQKQLEVAKGGLMPTLSLGASYRNNYYNKARKIVDINAGITQKISFSEQVKNNDREAIGLTLRIPIFNKFQNKTRISNAKIDIEQAELDLENQKLRLRKDIETAYTLAISALKRFQANQSATVSLNEAFRYTAEKYSMGVVTTVEYNEAKNNLTKSQSDLLQAKYEYIFRSKILDFYNGIPISL